MDPQQLTSLFNTTATAITTSLKHYVPQALEYAQGHPTRTALIGTSIIAYPLGGTAAIAGWALKAAGFGSAGPIGGESDDLSPQPLFVDGVGSY